MDSLKHLEDAKKDISVANTRDEIVAAVSAHKDNLVKVKKDMLKNRVNRGIVVVDLADDLDSLRESDKKGILRWISRATEVIENTPAQNLAAIQSTEKEFLSKKAPEDVANKIASYLSGKKGSIKGQLKQIKERLGGRKTKKNRSSKRKTYGRRV